VHLTRTLRIVNADKAERGFSFANRFPWTKLARATGLDGRQFSLASGLANPISLTGACVACQQRAAQTP